MNHLVLMTTQAAIGLIGPGWLAIAVGASDQEIIVYAAIEAETDDDRDDLQELVADLGAFLEGGPDAGTPIRLVVHVGPIAATLWPAQAAAGDGNTRQVFSARPRASR